MDMEIDTRIDYLATLTELSNRHGAYSVIKSIVYLQYGVLQTHGRNPSSWTNPKMNKVHYGPWRNQKRLTSKYKPAAN